MKAFKIVLAVAVAGLIGFFVWKRIIGVKPPGDVRPETNQFTESIQAELDSLRKTSATVFCKEFYENILYHITDDHQHGYFAETDKDNDQWREIFLKDLFTVYAPKFVSQALYVFNGSEWETGKLNFIRSELKRLQSSSYLDQGSSLDDSFKEIRTILAKYDEIAGFIYACNGFSFTNYEMDALFPLDDMGGKISKAKTYLSNGLDNSYVNNCARLHEGLRNIPQKLFDKHVSYLRSKIQQFAGRYKQYDVQVDYSNFIFTPLRDQYDAIDNDIYGVSTDLFDSEYITLKNLLAADNREAADYFRNHNN
jgi:hypothetical protein